MNFLIICRNRKIINLLEQKVLSINPRIAIVIKNELKNIDYRQFNYIFISYEILTFDQIKQFSIELKKKPNIKIILLGSRNSCDQYLFMIHPYYYIRYSYFIRDVNDFINEITDEINYRTKLLLEEIDDYQNLFYIEKQNNDSIFYYKNIQIRKRITFKEIEKNIKINNDLIRIHKSYIINSKYIEKYTSKIVVLNNELIPVGRTYYKDFKRKLLCMEK